MEEDTARDPRADSSVDPTAAAAIQALGDTHVLSEHKEGILKAVIEGVQRNRAIKALGKFLGIEYVTIDQFVERAKAKYTELSEGGAQDYIAHLREDVITASDVLLEGRWDVRTLGEKDLPHLQEGYARAAHYGERFPALMPYLFLDVGERLDLGENSHVSLEEQLVMKNNGGGEELQSKLVIVRDGKEVDTIIGDLNDRKGKLIAKLKELQREYIEGLPAQDLIGIVGSSGRALRETLLELAKTRSQVLPVEEALELRRKFDGQKSLIDQIKDYYHEASRRQGLDVGDTENLGLVMTRVISYFNAIAKKKTDTRSIRIEGMPQQAITKVNTEIADLLERGRIRQKDIPEPDIEKLEFLITEMHFNYDQYEIIARGAQQIHANIRRKIKPLFDELGVYHLLKADKYRDEQVEVDGVELTPEERFESLHGDKLIYALEDLVPFIIKRWRILMESYERLAEIEKSEVGALYKAMEDAEEEAEDAHEEVQRLEAENLKLRKEKGSLAERLEEAGPAGQIDQTGLEYSLAIVQKTAGILGKRLSESLAGIVDLDSRYQEIIDAVPIAGTQLSDVASLYLATMRGFGITIDDIERREYDFIFENGLQDRQMNLAQVRELLGEKTALAKTLDQKIKELKRELREAHPGIVSDDDSIEECYRALSSLKSESEGNWHELEASFGEYRAVAADIYALTGLTAEEVEPIKEVGRRVAEAVQGAKDYLRDLRIQLRGGGKVSRSMKKQGRKIYGTDVTEGISGDFADGFKQRVTEKTAEIEKLEGRLSEQAKAMNSVLDDLKAKDYGNLDYDQAYDTVTRIVRELRSKDEEGVSGRFSRIRADWIRLRQELPYATDENVDAAEGALEDITARIEEGRQIKSSKDGVSEAQQNVLSAVNKTLKSKYTWTQARVRMSEYKHS